MIHANLPTGNELNQRIARLPEVIQITGLSRAAIYRELKRGFPQPLQLGQTRCIGWPIQIIYQWCQSQVQKRMSVAKEASHEKL